MSTTRCHPREGSLVPACLMPSPRCSSGSEPLPCNQAFRAWWWWFSWHRVLQDLTNFKIKKKLFKNWNIVDLKCCVTFRFIAQWVSYTYVYMSTLFQILFHYGLLQNVEYDFPCSIVGSCWLSILYISHIPLYDWWRRKWQPISVFLPGEYHGWRSLVGYSPQGHKESDTTERLHSCVIELTFKST